MSTCDFCSTHNEKNNFVLNGNQSLLILISDIGVVSVLGMLLLKS